MRPSDRILSVLPLSRSYGLYQLLMTVRLGATLHLRSSAGPVGDLLRDLREEAITVLPGVPDLWHLLGSGQAQGEPFRDVRLLTNGQGALPSERLSDLMRLFPGADVYAMYGQTECAGISYLPPELLAARPDSVGVPLPGTQVWLVDEAGRRAQPEEVGELVVRGPHVMQGYWGRPEATARRLGPSTRPGERLLRTGDIFRFDRDGYLCFVARRDDVVTSGTAVRSPRLRGAGPRAR
jgi:acyl-CoA synthetase (AMP-forming)/AMP-acid ligase II